MVKTLRSLLAGVFFFSIFLLSGCDGTPVRKAEDPATKAPRDTSAGEVTLPPDEKGAETVTTPEGPTATAPAQTIVLTATGSNVNTSTFDKKEIRLPANTQVRLTLVNSSKAFENMEQNLVIMESAYVDQLAPFGFAAGPQGHYVPEDKTHIIAYSKMAKPG
ncbi:MAG: hypothetical protein M3Q97_10275, partial [Bacteroidota bacterium]|nr:hypothetical protein [Bacteroidota bacterium]